MTKKYNFKVLKNFGKFKLVNNCVVRVDDASEDFDFFIKEVKDVNKKDTPSHFITVRDA